MIVYTNKHRVPFQIDSDDYEPVSYFSWHVGNGYIVTARSRLTYPQQGILSLQDFILGSAPKGLEWDHHNRITTDNRRSNLRAVPHTVNKRNEGVNSRNRSGVRGVSYNNKHGYWLVTIRVITKRIYVGTFYDLEQAKQARIAAENEYWGDAR